MDDGPYTSNVIATYNNSIVSELSKLDILSDEDRKKLECVHASHRRIFLQCTGV